MPNRARPAHRRTERVARVLGATIAATCAAGAVGAGLAWRSATGHAAVRTPASGSGHVTPTAPPAPTAPASHVQVLAIPAADAPDGVRRVWVYHPAAVDTASLPVVYFLHGLPGSYLDIDHLGGRTWLDRLIASRQVPPFVLVVPDGNSSRAPDPEWANAPARVQAIEQFVVSLRTQVEGDHPRNRADRSLVGFSMGGYGAMNIALHHPELYGAVASLAGYFDTDDESGIFRGDRTTLRQNSPDHHLDAARTLRVMIADGLDDRLDVSRGETQRFAALLRRAGTPPYVDLQPGGHDEAYLVNELPRALRFLLTGSV